VSENLRGAIAKPKPTPLSNSILPSVTAPKTSRILKSSYKPSVTVPTPFCRLLAGVTVYPPALAQSSRSLPALEASFIAFDCVTLFPALFTYLGADNPAIILFMPSAF